VEEPVTRLEHVEVATVIVTSERGTDLDGIEGYLFPDQYRG
jgi:hypothetical protein